MDDNRTMASIAREHHRWVTRCHRCGRENSPRTTLSISTGSGTLPSNTITNPKVDLKGITTLSGVAYQGPTIPTTSSPPPKVVERETRGDKGHGDSY
ncbi:hypothetical protein Tco_0388713 [Tanacetum coccineum]